MLQMDKFNTLFQILCLRITFFQSHIQDQSQDQFSPVFKISPRQRQQKLLVVHLQNQLYSVKYWTVVIPESLDIKNQILTECRAVPYSAHPGVQRILHKVRQSFYWKGQTGDVRIFVDSWKICRTEKSYHSL